MAAMAMTILEAVLMFRDITMVCDSPFGAGPKNTDIPGGAGSDVPG
jgi:hypothetical protein